MKLALFSPYGFFHREAGLMYLVANYLSKNGAEVVQLRCDGAFAVCGRDQKHKWNRTLFSCARCMSEQRALASWALLKTRDASSFLIPDDVLQAARWISAVRAQDLTRIEFRGINLWELCKSDLLSRFPEASVLGFAPDEDGHLRALIVSAVHALVAVERFATTTAPSLSFVVSTGDVLSNAYVAQAKASGAETAVFSYDPSEEAIAVEALRSGVRYNTRLILEGITSMRSDPRTWAPEVTAIVHEMLTFLGYAPDLIPA